MSGQAAAMQTPTMQIMTTIEATRAACHVERRNGRTLGLVPTMGALHEGHLSLVRAAKASCDVVAVSLFVNPTQFGPQEDFGRYPRTFENDCALLEREGVDLLFAPTATEMYPPHRAVTVVDVPELGTRLDGASRPGHFRGVATVVAKLFHIIGPDRAFFGQKDAAQVAVLQAMVRDLNFPLALVVCPTVREPDGLAMSSRNRYLSAEERQSALALSQALEVARRLCASGQVLAHDVRRLLHARLDHAPGVALEYAEVVDAETLLPVETLQAGALVAVAARVGATRLIDNIVLAPTSSGGAA